LTQIAENTVKRLALIALIFLFVLSVATPLIQPAKAVTYSYTFNGPYDENYGVIYVSDSHIVVITLYFADGTAPIVPATLSGIGTHTVTVTPASKPEYFSFSSFNLTGDGTNFVRQYWLGPNENTGTYNINIPITTINHAPEAIYVNSPYTINFLDTQGILQTYPYIRAEMSNNGTYQIIEQRKIDLSNTVIMGLEPGNRYRISYGDGTTWNIYGDLVAGDTLGIQLILRGVDFSSAEAKKQLLLYQYVHAYAQRDFLNPIGAITVSYEDLTSQTTSVTVTITDNGTTVFSNVYTSQTFSATWNSAVNATNYEVTIAIVHATFGSFHFDQYLPGEYTKASDPFSLSFLGSTMGISTAVLIPALLIIFVAGCFSELTSETAAILTVIIAIILSALGWIDIGQGAIISALALAVMSGIIAAKRRINVY
jgi:hypothetical protein